jgi:hypothetical protein
MSDIRNTDCRCGHPEAEHFWSRCVFCDRPDYRCTCDEDEMQVCDGCDGCDCEGFAERKPPPAPAPDLNQAVLF